MSERSDSTHSATSKDGTRIVYDQYGSGPVIILVGATMGSRVFGPAPLAKLLAKKFTVIDYDRRGRGESGDNKPYDPHKEVEDIAVLIDASGGSASLCGLSSGAALAMEAAIELGPGRVKKLAMYEGPYTSDPTVLKEWQDYGKALKECMEHGTADDAVLLFLKLVHAEGQAGKLRQDKSTWGKLKKLSPTLIYDYRVIGETKQIPKQRVAKVRVPTLVMSGEASGLTADSDAKQLASLMPHATHRMPKGQTHDADPQSIAPVLADFFRANPRN